MSEAPNKKEFLIPRTQLKNVSLGGKIGSNLLDGRKDRHVLTMESLLIGKGWYEVEKEGDEYFRWLGPETSATIHLEINRRIEHRLNVVIHKFGSEEILKSLNLSVDGTTLQTTKSTSCSPAYITAVLPKDMYKSLEKTTILKFSVSNKLVCERVSKSHDSRKLSIALQSLHIFPLSRPLFISQKFSDQTPFDGIDYIRKNQGVADLIIHGIFSSAYEHYLQKRNGGYSPELHAEFDECPGDLYDIIVNRAKVEKNEIKNHLIKEIKFLREILYRQGDIIREMKNMLDSAAKG